MAKKNGSYDVSRTNAMKYGVTVDRPMTCPGTERCRYRYCEDLSFEPPHGSYCPWETNYAAMLDASYRRTYDFPAMREELENLDEIIETLVSNALRRNRISFRTNRSGDMFTGISPTESWTEYQLCDRYLASCLREIESILAIFDTALAAIAARGRTGIRRRTGMVYTD